VRAVIIYESLTGNTRRASEIIARELGRQGVATTVCNITSVDLDALSQAELVVVGTWTDGLFFFGQRPGRGGRLKDKLPAMQGKRAATFVTFALEPRRTLDKLTDIVRATGAEVIGGMAIRRDDLEGGAQELADRLVEAVRAAR
jgi:flavodoxin I